MTNRQRQRGIALFTAIFLIVVIAAVAAAFALMTTTQQVSSARALDAEGAYAAAMGRLELAVGEAMGGGCGAVQEAPVAGFPTQVDCDAVDNIREGGNEYSVYTIAVTAFRGDRRSGTLVRRTVRAQVTDAD